MILRSTQLGDQKVTLGALPGRPASNAGTRDRSAEAKLVVPAAVGPVEREPTFEDVAAWLRRQDDRTRKACAALLTDEMAHIYELAHERGLASGREAAEAEAAKRSAAELEQLRKVTAGAERLFEQEVEQLRAQCAEIVAEALTKIGATILASDTTLIGAVAAVVARVQEGREIIIRLAPDDLSRLQRLTAQLEASLLGRKFELVADARVELGGCIVETSHGSFDARFEVQLRQLFETLRATRSSRGDEP